MATGNSYLIWICQNMDILFQCIACLHSVRFLGDHISYLDLKVVCKGVFSVSGFGSKL